MKCYIEAQYVKPIYYDLNVFTKSSRAEDGIIKVIR
jgi:hypothetical protein